MIARIRPYLPQLRAFADAYAKLADTMTNLQNALDSLTRDLPGYPKGWDDFESEHALLHERMEQARQWAALAANAAAGQDSQRGVLSISIAHETASYTRSVHVEWAGDRGNQERMTWEDAKLIAQASPEFNDVLLEALARGGEFCRPGSAFRR